MTKKQWLVALVLLLLIPLVWVLGLMLFDRIHPEIAAGHPNYVPNYPPAQSAEAHVFVGI
jgi:hypothetical protein